MSGWARVMIPAVPNVYTAYSFECDFDFERSWIRSALQPSGQTPAATPQAWVCRGVPPVVACGEATSSKSEGEPISAERPLSAES